MHSVVIVNTSPLFYLHRLGYLYLLEKLYGEIVIPHAVITEIEEGKKLGEDVPNISDYKWLKIKNVTIPAFIKMLHDLGLGEADVLARRIAKLQEFKLTGTAGVLLRAKKEGYITEVKSTIGRLKEVGFYLTPKLIGDILRIAA